MYSVQFLDRSVHDVNGDAVDVQMITMFSASTSTQDLNKSSYSIPEQEDVEPWKGVFVDSLRKVSTEHKNSS